MEKNVAGKWTVFAYGDPDHATLAGKPVPGDAANITANIRIDGGAANAVDDTNPAELEDGYYIFDITAVESNGEQLTLCPQSSTANVIVIAVPGSVWTRPANFSDLSVTASTGRTDVASVAGTSQTANDNGADINTLLTRLIGTIAAGTHNAQGGDSYLGATAHANLVNQYDGDGIIGDTFPATQAAVGNLATGSAAISTTAESFTKAGAEPETNTYTSTVQLDGTFHIVEDDVTSTDIYYQFDVGGDGVPTEFKWDGYAQSNGDSYTVHAYNWGSTSWDQIGSLVASNSTTLVSEVWQATTAHVGTGANLGKARLRFLSSDGTAIATDRLLCSFAIVARSVGYADGAIWIDTNGSNTNTEPHVDGVADNKVSTWAAALTLSAALNITRFRLVSGSGIILTGNSDNYEIVGQGYTLDLNGQSVAGLFVFGGTVIGTGTGAGIVFEDCPVGNVTLPPCVMRHCFYYGTITNSGTGDWFINDPRSRVAGSGTPIFDFGAAIGNTNLNIRANSGGWQLESMGDTGTDTASIEGWGQIVEGTCTSGTVTVRGAFTTSGFTNLTLSDDARFDTAQINALLVALGLDHLVAASVAGADVTDNSIIAKLVSASATADWDDFVNTTDSLQAIRDRGDAAWITGAGGSDRLLMVDTTIASLTSQTEFVLTAGSVDDDAYNNLSIVIEDASTATQKAVGTVLNYVGSTKTIVLKEALAFIIAATDKVYILAENSLKSTVANRQLDVTATGAAGIDWGNVENKGTAVDLSQTEILLADVVNDVTNLHASTATLANQTTILNRIGAFTGTGINTILGFFKTALSKTASNPSDLGGTYDAAADSQEAVRDRGDVAWITGGGAGLTDIINIQPLIPNDIDLADTATYRIGLILVNSLDDLPSIAEITPGTISIDRKAIGGTSWSAIVTDAACSEIAGLIYYDEVFDTGAGYAEGDSIRITLKSQKVTVSANDYEIIGATGRIFYTNVRQTMRGTENAATATALATAQGDLDIITGSNGALIEGTIQTLDPVAAQVTKEHRNTDHLIESQRGKHTATGDVYYWDPVNGNDTWDGLSKATARATFTSIHDNLVTDNNHDVIMAIPGNATGITVTNEEFTISKNYTFLRGPGRDFRIVGDSAADVITITGNGVELSGFVVNTHTSGTGIGINVDGGNFSWLHDLWLEYARGHSIQLKDTAYSIISDVTIFDGGQSSGHGIMIDGSGVIETHHNRIFDSIIHACGNDGIHLKGVNAHDNFIYGGDTITSIGHNGGYGINDEGTAIDTHVMGPNLFAHENTSGNYSLTGTGALRLNTDEWAKDSICTETRLSELDAATAGKMAFVVDEIVADTGELQSDDVPGLIVAHDTSIDSQLASIATKLPFKPTKGVAFANFKVFMVLASDSKTGAPGLTVSGLIQQGTGTFTALTNSVVEIGNGMYRVDLTAAEMNADSISLIFTAATADARVFTMYSQAA